MQIWNLLLYNFLNCLFLYFWYLVFVNNFLLSFMSWNHLLCSKQAVVRHYFKHGILNKQLLRKFLKLYLALTKESWYFSVRIHELSDHAWLFCCYISFIQNSISLTSSCYSQKINTIKMCSVFSCFLCN